VFGEARVFGDVVRAHRRRLGLSQEELAARTGVGVRSIGKIEAGRIKEPRPATVRLLADGLGLVGTERDRFCEASSAQDPSGAFRRGVPAQLPAEAAGFIGRAEQVRRLSVLLTEGAAVGKPTVALVTAIAGSAGVGKTALAVHWAHQVRDRFPDGQLYVNLRGFDPAGSAMTPTEAIRRFLDALHVPPQQVPTSLDAQIDLYRNLLTDKRVLVVLDNARDAEQARPLLPGTRASCTVVTSRNQLTGLVAADGAHPVPLGVLPRGEAREFLANRLGTARVTAEAAAVEEIITACAQLPLALGIAAARAQQTGFPLETLAAELSRADTQLDALDTGDPNSEVRSVFSWSYVALTPPAASLFRLLGLHPGPDISAAATASLVGHPLPATRQLLNELTRANLLSEHAPGRYTVHDLLRAYAADLTGTHDPADTRHAAMTRLLDHYTHTAYAADRCLISYRDPIPVPLGPPDPGATPETPVDHQAAMAWLTTERPVLLSAVRQAVAWGFDTQAWQLAWAVNTFLYRRGHHNDLATTWQAALDAAGRLDNPLAQAYALRLLADAQTRLGHDADSHDRLQHALELYTRAGDQAGQARTHQSLARLLWRQDYPGQALDHAEQALTLFTTADHRLGQAFALNWVGWCHAQLDDHGTALEYCRQALALHQQLDDLNGEAHTWNSIGYAHYRLGHLAEAVECYQRAIELFRGLEDRYNEATVLTHLGEAHHVARNPVDARAAWQQALDILIDIDQAGVEAIRARLSVLP
jgi:transcriptional regulator with XRE-family HTH domain